MDSNAPYVTNLVNSIIGVSVLAMPFCMKKCGLLLGLGLLFGMSWLTYISCNMLISAAFVKRRRTYEYLAFYTVGSTGKFAVELSMIGLMLGTCVAFYVIIGDLATAILQGFVEAEPVQLRTFVIVFCALCIALPLGLMKNLSILGFIGFFSLIFYCIFVCVMVVNSVSSGLLTFEWLEKVELFRPAGVFQCLPIFSLAYACQCQLFVVYDSLEDASVMRMESIVVNSLKIVTFVYCMVAILGYTTYIDSVEGNVLKNFSQNISLDLIKCGFAVSVVVGFPLMIFPCRQSIHTLFFSQHPADGVPSKTYIEPFTFKAITLCIVLATMMVAIFIPNVETILGLTGATMGSFICFIFPGIIFSKASPKGNTMISKFVLGMGCVLLVLCTYSNVYSAVEMPNVPAKHPVIQADVPDAAPVREVIENPVPEEKNEVQEPLPEPTKPPVAEVIGDEHRHEPKNPVEPVLVDKEKDEEHALPKEEEESIKHKEEAEHPVKQDGEISKENEAENVEGAREALVEPQEVKKAEPVVDENVQKPEEPVIEQHHPVADDQAPNPNVLPKKEMNAEDPVVNANQGVPEKPVEQHPAEKPVESVDNKEEPPELIKSDHVISEDQLLDKIEEQHKKQHELLDAQELLIQSLKEQRDKEHKVNPHEVVKNPDLVEPVHKVEVDAPYKEALLPDEPVLPNKVAPVQKQDPLPIHKDAVAAVPNENRAPIVKENVQNMQKMPDALEHNALVKNDANIDAHRAEQPEQKRELPNSQQNVEALGHPHVPVPNDHHIADVQAGHKLEPNLENMDSFVHNGKLIIDPPNSDINKLPMHDNDHRVVRDIDEVENAVQERLKNDPSAVKVDSNFVKVDENPNMQVDQLHKPEIDSKKTEVKQPVIQQKVDNKLNLGAESEHLPENGKTEEKTNENGDSKQGNEKMPKARDLKSI